MASQWHYQLLGEEFGPVAEDMLRDLIAHGTLGNDDPVRCNGGAWMPASQALAANRDSASSVATITDDEPVDADDSPEWYYQVLGQEMGPLSFNDLCKFAENGELKADDVIRFGTSGRWRRVGSVGRLVSLLPYQNSSVTRVGQKKAAPKPATPAPPTVAPPPPPEPMPVVVPEQPAAPQVAYAPAASELAWFAWIRGVESGPKSLLQLQEILDGGGLGPNDAVKYGRTGAWCPPVTIKQVLSQYAVVIPATPVRNLTPVTAMPTVSPAETKKSAVSMSTVAAAKPAPKPEVAKPEVSRPAPPEPVAKAESPYQEAEKPSMPEPAPRSYSPPASTASTLSASSYGSSTSNWQAKTVSAPPPRPAKASRSGPAFDFSGLTSMVDAKSLGMGGGALAVLGLIAAWMFMPEGFGVEAKYFKELHPIYVEFQQLRKKNGSPGELKAIADKVAKVCPPIVKALEPRANSSRPVSQKLFWVAKYRMNEMITKGAAKRTSEEIQCERMLYEVAQQLKIPMDKPEPAEVIPLKTSTAGVGPAKGGKPVPILNDYGP